MKLARPEQHLGSEVWTWPLYSDDRECVVSVHAMPAEMRNRMLMQCKFAHACNALEHRMAVIDRLRPIFSQIESQIEEAFPAYSVFGMRTSRTRELVMLCAQTIDEENDMETD